MLSYIFVKPEAIHLAVLLKNKKEEGVQPQGAEAVLIEGMRCLLRGEKPKSREIRLILMGLSFPEAWFSYLYPSPPEELGNALKNAVVGKPFGLIFLQSEREFMEWKEAKGKFMTDTEPRGAGLRGSLRAIRDEHEPKMQISEGELTKLPVEQNFVHTPDSPEEAQALLERITRNQKKGVRVLWDREAEINSGVEQVEY